MRSFIKKHLWTIVMGLLVVLIGIYGLCAWLFMRSLPIDYLVAASLDGTRLVPKSAVYWYVTHSDDARVKIKTANIPLIGMTINAVAENEGANDPARLSKACSLILLELENGQSIDSRLPGGFTPLMSAVLLNQPEVVKFVISNGANMHLLLIRTAQNVTIEMSPLQYAQNLQEKNPKIDRSQVIKILLGENDH
jgi:ankyrin repeat protein